MSRKRDNNVDTQKALLPVAAFFRDHRLNRPGSALSQDDAALLLRDFHELYSPEACSADQLLALADLALRAKDYDSARLALNRALQTPGKAHLAYYKLGRLEMTKGDPVAAAEQFALGAEADAAFPFNWMGRARALHAQGRRMEAAGFAERFALFGVRPHGQDEFAILADLADALFEAGDRTRARPIYDLLSAHGHSNGKVLARQAETMMAAGNHQAALAMLRPAHLAGQLDLWGRRALAHCESLDGNAAEAIEIAESVVAERPEDRGFVATLMDALVRSRDSARWQDAIARLPHLLPEDGLRELQARLALTEGDVARAAELLRPIVLQRQTRLFHAAVEIAYAALGAGMLGLAQDLADRLEAAAPGELPTVILRADLCLQQQLWEQAGAILADVPEELAELPQILLKRFEYACFVGNVAEARLLQAQLEDSPSLPRQHLLPVLRFLAEQQMWPELADRALRWLSSDFRYDQIGYVLFRAAKRTGRHADFLAAIEAIGGWRENADLSRLHTTLAWDRADTLAEMDLLAASFPALSPGMRRRLEVQRDILACASAPGGRRALFLCTNRNYLCATIVALHSALRHARPDGHDSFIVVDDDLVELTDRLVQPFRDRGFIVRVVAAGEVVESADRLHAAYGLFTSGHLLASAAYYRIYFARHLRAAGDYARAVYIDSDVLVRTPLDRLFTLDLQGQPLLARVETPRPEVARAIALHRLQGDLYFNSGVLLFDLQSDLLPAALDDTVGAILDDGVTLLFHDQCALNLGFQNRFQRLGMNWNFPIGESADLAAIPPDTAILHYLDRPKPWSSAYHGECATLWFDEWRETAAMIGEAAAVELFRMSSD